MIIHSTALPGVLRLEPKVFGDDRGFFFESYNAREFLRGTGFDGVFVQDNHSRSVRGVLRGLHYQITQPQGKLVRVIVGEVYDVAVDIRRSSPTFGQHYGCRLSAENRQMLWIPPGFAHGFLTLSEHAEFLYKTTDYWLAAAERSIRWDDPALGIGWPLDQLGAVTPVLSPKDMRGSLLADAEVFADS
ncbi:MAG: dTDP-4-dehydrorhamnose 3,5-epimerase [Ferrovum sp.]|jgi:dTDP-4-dehydrorhamnose 3,5-epimerase|nr:dTDP-4-dehydrorhamnose 3,5-epimerase [Ferrovum sp.]